MTCRRRQPHPSIAASGFSLVEVSLALALVGFCLIGLLGLLPVGLSASGDAGDRTRAINIATAVAADLENAPPGATETLRYALPVPPAYQSFPASTLAPFEVTATGARYARNQGGARTIALNPRYQVTVTIHKPSAFAPPQASIEVAWPIIREPTSRVVVLTTLKTP